MSIPALAVSWDQLYRTEIDRTIAEAVGSLESSTLKEIVTHATTGGKRIRPILTLLACAAAGGRWEDALPAAAAVELLHASSLVHDDIMDRSELRRGMPTVHTKHGVPMAVLAGDALIALAYRLLHKTPSTATSELCATFSHCFVSLCEGQCADIECPYETRADHSQHGWMVERKTARLLEACTKIGALVATLEERTIHALAEFGFHLGIAYQAMDDLIDATADEAVVGKSVRVDARNGRHTYLTLEHPESDLLAATRTLVGDHTTKAIAALDVLPPSEARERLRELSHLLLERRS